MSKLSISGTSKLRCPASMPSLPGGFPTATIFGVGHRPVFAHHESRRPGRPRRNAGDRHLQRVPNLVRSRVVAGALVRNQSLHFVCQPVWLRVKLRDSNNNELEGKKGSSGCPLRTGKVRIRHETTLEEILESKRQVVFRYADESGDAVRSQIPTDQCAISQESVVKPGMWWTRQVPQPPMGSPTGQRRWKVTFCFVNRNFGTCCFQINGSWIVRISSRARNNRGRVCAGPSDSGARTEFH